MPTQYAGPFKQALPLRLHTPFGTVSWGFSNAHLQTRIGVGTCSFTAALKRLASARRSGFEQDGAFIGHGPTCAFGLGQHFNACCVLH